VLLVDNSLTIRADVDKLEQAAREFAYEIYEGDKLLIVGYDEQAEIVSDWTDDAKLIETKLKLFRKKGQPYLGSTRFAQSSKKRLRPVQNTKRIIVVISDGLDRGSKSTFEQTLAELQTENIMVYAVQAVDRTRGAIRRDVPKPKVVIDSSRKERADRSSRSTIRKLRRRRSATSCDRIVTCCRTCRRVRRTDRRAVCWWWATRELRSDRSQCNSRTNAASTNKRVPP
jgi:VWFA-related protein